MAGIHKHVNGSNLWTVYCMLTRWRPWKKNQVAVTHILQPAAGQPPGMHCTSLIDVLIFDKNHIQFNPNSPVP
jgi:hypothetical protein